MKFGIGFVLALISLPVFASGEDEHHLSVSGGIAAPSYSSAVFQNPAGLVYNSKLKATVQAELDPVTTMHGGILGGNETFGGAAGVSHTFEGRESTSLFYGLAARAQSLSTTLGVSGFTRLNNGGGTGFNAGLMIEPSTKYNVGITALNIDSSVSEWGAGVQMQLDTMAAFILDATANHSFNAFGVQPGFIIGSPKMALTISYGFEDDGSHSAQLGDGFAAGGSLEIFRSASWQIYYHQMAEWYTSLSFEF